MNEEKHTIKEWWEIRTAEMTMPLPCFECGDEVEILWRGNVWYVQCQSCMMRIKMPLICGKVEDVIKIWNLLAKQNEREQNG